MCIIVSIHIFTLTNLNDEFYHKTIEFVISLRDVAYIRPVYTYPVYVKQSKLKGNVCQVIFLLGCLFTRKRCTLLSYLVQHHVVLA